MKVHGYFLEFVDGKEIRYPAAMSGNYLYVVKNGKYVEPTKEHFVSKRHRTNNNYIYRTFEEVYDILYELPF